MEYVPETVYCVMKRFGLPGKPYDTLGSSRFCSETEDGSSKARHHRCAGVYAT